MVTETPAKKHRAVHGPAQAHAGSVSDIAAEQSTTRPSYAISQVRAGGAGCQGVPAERLGSWVPSCFSSSSYRLSAPYRMHCSASISGVQRYLCARRSAGEASECTWRDVEIPRKHRPPSKVQVRGAAAVENQTSMHGGPTPESGLGLRYAGARRAGAPCAPYLCAEHGPGPRARADS